MTPLSTIAPGNRGANSNGADPPPTTSTTNPSSSSPAPAAEHATAAAAAPKSSAPSSTTAATTKGTPAGSTPTDPPFLDALQIGDTCQVLWRDGKTYLLAKVIERKNRDGTQPAVSTAFSGGGGIGRSNDVIASAAGEKKRRRDDVTEGSAGEALAETVPNAGAEPSSKRNKVEGGKARAGEPGAKRSGKGKSSLKTSPKFQSGVTLGVGGVLQTEPVIVSGGKGGKDIISKEQQHLQQWQQLQQQQQQQQQQQHLHPPQQQQQQQQQLNLDMGDDFRAAQQIARQHHAPPSPRHSHAAVVYNDCMYVFGGYDGSYRSDFHEFDFRQLSWRPVFGSGRSPRARYRSTACVLQDRMILFGGHDGTRHLSDVHTFDFVTQVWTLLMTDGVPPLPRDSHVSVVYKDSMYVFGGSTGSAMNDLHELMFPPPRQALIATDSPAAPDYTTTAYGGNGPEDGGGPSSLPQDGSVAAKWRQIPPVPGGGIAIHRFCHVGAVYNGALYVFGGYDGSSRLNDFVKYDLAADDLFETYIPPPTLLSDLRSFLDDEGAMSLSDITIMVENVPVRAHKLMLMRCPYFRAMLLGDMAESSQSIVSIEIVRHPIFLAVLEYLYTDDVPIPLDSAMELFVAADLFGIPRLQAMCERRLLESITVENAATIFHAADVHSANSLRNKALGYVLSHFEAVSKTTAFEDMARCNVELVFEILKNR
mmetsp:Transcript_12893/g.27176  ORF Transcript_12893/g.27176 Transcript_12893/m.27176 type:complete len:705 (+) Transcript_12893:65-2179(+)